MFSVNLVTWLLAFSPIAVVLLLMVGLRWGAAKAGAAGWLTALAAAVLFFGADARLVAFSQVKGILLSFYVLYIIWMALLLYSVVAEAGAVEVIGLSFSRLTQDRTMQFLLLGWVFSSFLQGAGGFGVPVAVAAPLLMAAGFDPSVAVVGTLLGHTWSVSLGSMGSSHQALMAATGLSGEALAPWAATYLGILCFAAGAAMVHVYGGFRSVWRGAIPILVIGTAMSVTQYVVATAGLWNLSAFLAGTVGLVVGGLLTRLPALQRGEARLTSPSGAVEASHHGMSVLWAAAPYLLLIIIVLLPEMWPTLTAWLDRVQIQVAFPEMRTALGWVQPAENGRNISIFGHPGALLLYTSLLSYLFYRRQGFYAAGAAKRIVSRTLSGSIASSLGIVTMVGFAMLMSSVGMTFALAQGISETMGRAYPFFAPFVGALGAFMTGSNTNSNVIFGQLQRNTAELIGSDVLIVLAAQTAGAAIGSVLAPAKVIVGASTCGLAGQEGRVLRATVGYGVLLILSLGVLTMLVI